MYVIGLMSGTSLDGLDIAYCEFSESEGLRYKLLAAETYPYPQQWVDRLSTLEHASAYEYALAHVELGHYFGKCVNRFRKAHPGKVDLVASHGHTIFHQPQLGLTTQIADGDAIAAETGLPVAFNFRTFDVALGGQGAPLVPIGDRLLFGDYDACLNLGGFSNISYEESGLRKAFDVSPCNMALNALARNLGMDYDRDGILASQGALNEDVLQKMNALEYYHRPAPKSLGKEWYIENFLPLIASQNPQSMLRTTVEHIAQQVSKVVSSQTVRTLLVTGGGAKNKFLVERIAALSPQCSVTIPDHQVVDYKEAIVFALLGYLRIKGQNNCLQSVTGASLDNCSGQLSGI
ncbi:MAG: anhydro-N-acetylmuramic acid kinase [Bacteroidales bacterium]|nr:anhydro-N-acetylmuramic acid kinase [Candidatus Colimorpha pelethequi]